MKTVYAIGGVALLAYLFLGKKNPETAAAQAQPQPQAAPARKGRPAPPQAETQVQAVNNEDDMSAREKSLLTIYTQIGATMQKSTDSEVRDWLLAIAMCQSRMSDAEVSDMYDLFQRAMAKKSNSGDEQMFKDLKEKFKSWGAFAKKSNTPVQQAESQELQISRNALSFPLSNFTYAKQKSYIGNFNKLNEYDKMLFVLGHYDEKLVKDSGWAFEQLQKVREKAKL